MILCPKCGGNSPDGTIFCVHCGARLPVSEQQPAEQTPVFSPTEHVNEEYTPAQPEPPIPDPQQTHEPADVSSGPPAEPIPALILSVPLPETPPSELQQSEVSSPKASKPKSKKLIIGIAAGVLAVVIAAVCVFAFSGGSREPVCLPDFEAFAGEYAERTTSSVDDSATYYEISSTDVAEEYLALLSSYSFKLRNTKDVEHDSDGTDRTLYWYTYEGKGKVGSKTINYEYDDGYAILEGVDLFMQTWYQESSGRSFFVINFVAEGIEMRDNGERTSYSAPAASPEPEEPALSDEPAAVPDFFAFADGYAVEDSELRYYLYPDAADQVIEEYLSLLESDYPLQLKNTTDAMGGGSSYEFYWYTYTGSSTIETVDLSRSFSSGSVNIKGAALIIQIEKKNGLSGECYVDICASPDAPIVDNGERTTCKASIGVANIPDFGVFANGYAELTSEPEDSFTRYYLGTGTGKIIDEYIDTVKNRSSLFELTTSSGRYNGHIMNLYVFRYTGSASVSTKTMSFTFEEGNMEVPNAALIFESAFDKQSGEYAFLIFYVAPEIETVDLGEHSTYAPTPTMPDFAAFAGSYATDTTGDTGYTQYNLGHTGTAITEQYFELLLRDYPYELAGSKTTIWNGDTRVMYWFSYTGDARVTAESTTYIYDESTDDDDVTVENAAIVMETAYRPTSDITWIHIYYVAPQIEKVTSRVTYSRS